MIGVHILAFTKDLCTAVIAVVVKVCILALAKDLRATVVAIVVSVRIGTVAKYLVTAVVAVMIGIGILALAKRLCTAVIAIVIGILILTDADGYLTAVLTYVVAVGVGMIAHLAATSITRMVAVGVLADQEILAANIAKMIRRILVDAVVCRPGQRQCRDRIAPCVGEYVFAIQLLNDRTHGSRYNGPLIQGDRAGCHQRVRTLFGSKRYLATKEGHVAGFHTDLTRDHGHAAAIQRQRTRDQDALCFGFHSQRATAVHSQVALDADAVFVVGIDLVFSDQNQRQTRSCVNSLMAIILFGQIYEIV